MTAPRIPQWRVGRLGATDIFLRPSLLVMAVLLVLVFAPQFSRLDQTQGYLVAGIFVIALYLSILLHEVAHLVVARAHRMPVPSIELHLMGGETLIAGRSRTASQEFLTAFAGPVVSILLGIGALLLAGDSAGVVDTVLFSLGLINVLVGAFNLLPSPPLDGGRIVRALAWALTRSESMGIRVAATCGRLTAITIAIGGPLVFGWESGVELARVALVWFVAWYLWKASGHSRIHEVRAARVAALSARELARDESPPPDARALPVGLRGHELLTAMAENPVPVYALVDDDGSVVGSLHAEDVDRAYREAT